MNLFSKYRLGGLELANRIVMSPMTRSRAVEGNAPGVAAPVYYAQRASAGLIITEGSQISPRGAGYIRTPGIYSHEQINGWRQVTDAVHKAGGNIFLQLWHVGRVSHPDFHGGARPVAPSALPVAGEIFTPQGRKKIETPRALELREIPGLIEQYRQGALNAKAAGFDGVEIHGANGYLLDQFLRDGSNRRTDSYGGSLQKRMRLPLEVAQEVISIWGAERVGYRISPHYAGVSMSDSNPRETFLLLAKELSALKTGYLHLVESLGGRTPRVADEARMAPLIRESFNGTFILNGGYDMNSGNEAVENNEADLISFGSLFLANPDLPERFMRKAPLNEPDPDTFYAGEERGYIDYPKLDAVTARV